MCSRVVPAAFAVTTPPIAQRIFWVYYGVMSRVCTVCAHLERAEMDRRLSFQVCNVAALAREFGLKDDAVHAHRRNHLPAFLPALQAQADALTLSQVQAEAQRLYMITLDALARAEAGTLRMIKRTDPDTGQEVEVATNVVSHTSVARFIREARAGLDQLTRLAADTPDEQGRPSNEHDAELGEAIRAELKRVVARNAGDPDKAPIALDAVQDAEVVEVDECEVGQGELLAGDGQTVGSGADRTGRESPPDGGQRSSAVHQRPRLPASDSLACRRRVRQ
jgi:hypothetical protein